MSSRNWKAVATPSIDGSKTELNVSGEVQSGIVPPKLTKRPIKRPPNVFALNVSGIAGGGYVTISHKEDITGNDKYNIVLVYNEQNEIEAAILIDSVQSLKG
jgi:hypothetical protein